MLIIISVLMAQKFADITEDAIIMQVKNKKHEYFFNLTLKKGNYYGRKTSSK